VLDALVLLLYWAYTWRLSMDPLDIKDNDRAVHSTGNQLLSLRQLDDARDCLRVVPRQGLDVFPSIDVVNTYRVRRHACQSQLRGRFQVTDDVDGAPFDHLLLHFVLQG
jgi:hypothetical protein